MRANVTRAAEGFDRRSFTVAEILRMVATLGGMVGCSAKAGQLVESLEAGIEEVRTSAARFARRPRVYFEEWDEPMISGIGWVSELVGIAGGDDIFPERAAHKGLRVISLDSVDATRTSFDAGPGSPH